MVGLATSTWALTEAGPRGWTDAAVVAAGAVSIAALAAFVWRMLHTHDPLVPPALFRNRTFTVVNLQTVLLYGALGVTFFLVSYELQVATGWSALKAGIALLPATVLMLLFSSSSGALAQRIGPRTQLTVGPLVAAAGLLLLARVGENASWVRDVLPGAIVFGIGLVTFVAPLTATVMAAADPNHVSVASGVNNAIARAAALTALGGRAGDLGVVGRDDPTRGHPFRPTGVGDRSLYRRGGLTARLLRPQYADARTVHGPAGALRCRRRTTAARIGHRSLTSDRSRAFTISSGRPRGRRPGQEFPGPATPRPATRTSMLRPGRCDG